MNKSVDILNAAFLADPNAIRALIINRVPCNKAIADDPFVVVHEDRNLIGEHFNVGALGLINAVLKAHNLPLVAVMRKTDEDVNEPNKMIGFCEYVE